MKKIILFAFLACASIGMRASTSITNATVSGHWTVTGSPYDIYKTITIATGDTLIIDPGVEVVFHGFYGIVVMGTLRASGTPAAPINYHSGDTTGWHNLTTYAGGWAGIKIDPDHFHPTLSLFDHADVRDIKYANDSGYLFTVNNTTLKLTACSFSHINVDHVFGTPTYSNECVFCFSSSDIEMDNCQVHDNASTYDIMSASSSGVNIHDCTFNDNVAGAVHSVGCVFKNNSCSVRFVDNAVYDNICGDGVFNSIYTYERDVLISGNKIYRNVNWGNATVDVAGGKTIIESNYICNNTDDSATCGITSGGGAIRVSGEYGSVTSTDTITKIVRNNIIANNRSTGRGSAICVYQCNAAIVNNDFVNNDDPGSQGTVYAYYGTNVNKLTIRNNIFQGNINNSLGVPYDVFLSNNNRVYLEYANNWIERGYSSNVFSNAAPDSVMLQTDSLTNIIGTNPGLTAPTVSASLSESALTANFQLQSTSACINAGGASGYMGSFDYPFNVRVSGSSVDVGAYEYGASPFPVGVPAIAAENMITVYPNPTAGFIFVNTPAARGTIYIYDLSGKLVAVKQVTDTLTSFDLNAVPKGVYLTTWDNGNAGKTTQKIIVD